MPTFGLAPGGVCRAARVTPDAGALLPHRFTLACARSGARRPSAVCSLWHFPAGRPDWPLASTLPCGAPTFLDPVTPKDPSRGHPADSPSMPVWPSCHETETAGRAAIERAAQTKASELTVSCVLQSASVGTVVFSVWARIAACRASMPPMAMIPCRSFAELSCPAALT